MEYIFSHDKRRTSIVLACIQVEYNDKIPNVQYIKSHTIQSTLHFPVIHSIRLQNLDLFVQCRRSFVAVPGTSSKYRLALKY